MARSKKKAISQRVVNAATTGMPSPVRKFLGGRIVALAIVVSLIALFATGVISVEWENGRPSLSFNRKQAKELKERTVEKIRDANGGTGFSLDFRKEESFGDKVADRVGEVKDRLTESSTPAWNSIRTEEQPARQAIKPLSRLKQRFEETR